jgi:hypothetical protein
MSGTTMDTIIYEQREPGSETLDAPEWLPTGGTKTYESAFVQAKVIDGFTHREHSEHD